MKNIWLPMPENSLTVAFLSNTGYISIGTKLLAP